MGEIIEIISDSSIDTTTEVGTVNLTQNDPLLCGFINTTKEERNLPGGTGGAYKLISSACMFMKQFSPFNLRLFETNTIDENVMTFVRVNAQEPAYFVCRINLRENVNNDLEDLECDELGHTIEEEKSEKDISEIIEKIKCELQFYAIETQIMYDDQKNILIVG